MFYKKRKKPVRAGRSGGRVPQASSRRRFKRKATARKGRVIKGAQKQLKNFRQASILAVAITGFLLTVLAPGEAGYAEENVLPAMISQDTEAVEGQPSQEDAFAEEDISQAAREEAIGTLQQLWEGFYENLPKIVVALAALLLAWVLVRFVRWFLPKLLGRWQGAGAAVTLVVIAVWLLALGVAISVIAGDIRALVGSLGLVGLALSWSLQVPIESFTGWLLNSFRGYYRIGDRISVGEVFGDVYRIDFLTTTVWEIGAPYRQGFVLAEQPTGRLVTFPNNEILSGTVVNYTGDFPYVWDELAVAVANESDIRLTMQVVEKVADELLSAYMLEPARSYSRILQKTGLPHEVADRPQLFVSLSESWTDISVRYLVGARERRKWKSQLTLLLSEALNKKEYQHKIIPVYPRQQVQLINTAGRAMDMPSGRNEGDDVQ